MAACGKRGHSSIPAEPVAELSDINACFPYELRGLFHQDVNVQSQGKTFVVTQRKGDQRICAAGVHVKGKVPASQVQAQSSAHFPSDASPAAVVHRQGGRTVTVVEGKAFRLKIVVGDLNAGIELVSDDLQPGVSREPLSAAFREGRIAAG